MFIGVTFLPMALPLSVLFASIYSFNRINSDSEFIALRSIGLSKAKILVPYFMVASTIAIVTFFLNQTIIPYASIEFKKGLKALHATNFISEMQSREFYSQIPGITLFAETIDKEKNELRDIFIDITESQSSKNKTITAKKGKFIQNIDKDNNENRIRLELQEGVIVTYQGEKIDKMFFQKYDFPLSETVLRKNVSMKPSMLTGKELIEIMNMNSKQLKDIRYKKKDLISVRLEFWTRFNTALQCILFVLVGFNFGIKNNRGDSNTTARNFLTLLLYYGFYFWGLSLARNEKIIPSIAVFVPSVLLMYFSYKSYKKLDWFG